MRSENARMAPLASARQQEKCANSFTWRHGIVDHFTSPVFGGDASKNPRLRWHRLARREEAKKGRALQHPAIKTTARSEIQRRAWPGSVSYGRAPRPLLVATHIAIEGAARWKLRIEVRVDKTRSDLLISDRAPPAASRVDGTVPRPGTSSGPSANGSPAAGSRAWPRSCSPSPGAPGSRRGSSADRCRRW